MRIGHYMSGLRYDGGIRSYIRRVVAAQRGGGHEVVLFDRAGEQNGTRLEDVVYTSDDQHLLDEAARRRLDVLHLHTIISDDVRIATPLIRTMHGHWPYCPSGSRYLRRWDSPCPRAYGSLGCMWGHFADLCGSRRPAKLWENFARTRAERRQLHRTPVITNSSFVRDQMIRSGYPAEQIRALPLPAPDVAEPDVRAGEGRADGSAGGAAAGEGASRLLFLGRLVPEKGAHRLLEAAARLEGEWRLDIAGDGPSLPMLRELAARLGVADRVTFHGWVPEARVFELMRACAVVVFPSLWHEPAGLVTLEAAAHARPVVATRVGGIPEYAELLRNVVLVAPADVEALAGAVQGLLRDPGRRAELGATGRARATERLSLGAHVEELLRMYVEFADAALGPEPAPAGAAR